MIGRRLLSDSAVYGTSRLLYSGLPILLTPLYTRFLTPVEMGTYELLALACTLANVVVTFEIAQGFARISVDAPNDAEKGVIAWSALVFSFTCYGLFLVACALAASELASLLIGEVGWERAFVTCAVSCSTLGLFTFFQQVLRWRLRPIAFTWSSLAYVALCAISSVTFLAIERSVVAIFAAQALSALCASVLAAYLGRAFFSMRFSWARCREMLAFSLPLVPSSLSVFAFNYSDRFLLQHYLGLAAVGVYGVAFKYAGTAAFLLLALLPALTPLVYTAHRDERTPRALAQALQLLSGLTLPIVVLLSVLAPEGLDVLGSAEYVVAAKTVPLLAGSAILARLYVFAPGLQLAKRTGLVALINMAAAFVNVALGLVWIPALGLTGAALATFVSSAGVCFASFALSHRHYPVPYNWRRIGQGAALACGTIALGRLVQPYPVARLLVGCVGAALILERLRLWQDFKAFWRSR